MKKLLLSTAAIMLAAPALAADLPRRSPAVAPAPVFTQAFSWQGFYVGAQVGYVWGESDVVSFSATPARVGGANVDANGFVGGLHAGYNWQRGSLVYGLEADIEYAALDGSANVLEGATVLARATVESQFRGSLRARLGVAFDRTLLYETGGLALGQVEGAFVNGANRASGSETQFGWTIGAGVEYAISNNWSARAEYRYTDLGDFNVATPTAVVTGAARSNIDTTDHSVRVGLSYRFGGPARPVVARY